MARNGSARTASSAPAGTSNTYPCGAVQPRPGPKVVSSHVSQLRHGVVPPAQLIIVPPALTKSRTRTGRPSASIRTSSVVVPPPASGS